MSASALKTLLSDLEQQDEPQVCGRFHQTCFNPVLLSPNTKGVTFCIMCRRGLRAWAHGWQVILVCSEEDSLSAEMQMLHAVHAAVAEDGRAHVMVYAADQACKMEVCTDFYMEIL